MFPTNLHASHFRYGTMSWENPWDNGTIRLKMQTGWRTAYNNTNYGTVGRISNMEGQISWGDGSANETVKMKCKVKYHAIYYCL